MPHFTYSGFQQGGKKIAGSVEADSLGTAKNILRAQGVMIVSLEPASARASRGALKGDDLATFTALLAQLIDAGVPLFDALSALEEQYRGEKSHAVIASLCEQIKAGRSLSEALAAFPNSFDSLYCSMVASGEASGSLKEVLDELASHQDKQQKLKSDLSAALIYPAVLLSFATLAVFLLLFFVVPSIEELFEGRELNGFTLFVVGSSHFLRDHGLLLIGMIAVAVGGSIYYLRTPKGKLFFQKMQLKLPIMRTVKLKIALGRFCRTLATLLQGGVPLVEALRIARGVVNHLTLQEELRHMEERVTQGAHLSDELLRSKTVPKLLARMAVVGEQSGTLATMFRRIASLYERELEKGIQQTLSLLQPLILVFMGVLIGGIMLAILLPLTNVGNIGL